MSVVGRGYVTIRAVTSGVERDVQQGVDRALGRVNANDGAEKLGKRVESKMGKTIGDGKETETGVKKSLNRTNVDNESKKLGDRIGEKISKSAGERSGGLLKKVLLSPISPALLNQTATLLSSTAAAGTALASTLGPVLAGGAGVGANALLGLGATLATVKLAFRKNDIPQFTARLGPAKAEVDKLSDSLQKRLFPSLSRSINGAMRSLGPTLRTGLGQTAKSIDHVTNRFAAMAQTPLFKTRLAGVLRTNAQALDLFGRAGVTSSGSFLALANAAGPLTVRFANFANKAADSAAQQINAAEASGKLEGFFNRAGDTTAQWGRVLGNTSKALFHVFDTGSQTGGVFLTKLENVTAKFDQWTQSVEGQSALKDWFAQSVPVMEATGRLLGALGKTFSGLSGGAGPLVTTLDFLSQGVLPALDAGLKVIIPPSNALMQVFASMSPVLNTVVPALNAIGTVVGNLPTPLQAAVGGLLLFAVAGDKIQTKLTGAKAKFASFGSTVSSNTSRIRGSLRGVVADLEIMASTSLTAGARTRAAMDRSAAAATRLRGRLGTMAVGAGKAAAVLGVVAASSSGLTDKLGLTEAASNALAGAMIGGPIGAGAGALIGVFQSLGSAAGDFRGTMKSVDSALDSNSLAAKKAALAQLELKASQLATGNSFKDNAERIYAFATGSQNKMVDKSKELRTEIANQEYAEKHLIPVVDALGNVTDSATGANYHFSSSLKAIMGNLTKTDAWLNYKQSVLDTKKALAENGKTLDANTEKGLANRKAIQAQAEALIQGATAFKDGSAAQDRYLIKGSQGLFKLADSLDKTGKFGDQLRRKFEALGRTKADPQLNVRDNATSPLRAFDAYLKSIGKEKASPEVKVLIGEAMRDLNIFRNTFFGFNGSTVTGTILLKKPSVPSYMTKGNSWHGGWIPGRSGGGWAVGPGSPTSDSILHNNTMISNREFVVNARQARKHANLLESINSGSLDSRPSSAGGTSPNINLNITTVKSGGELDEGVTRAMSRINLLMGT